MLSKQPKMLWMPTSLSEHGLLLHNPLPKHPLLEISGTALSRAMAGRQKDRKMRTRRVECDGRAVVAVERYPGCVVLRALASHRSILFKNITRLEPSTLALSRFL